ncbi:glycosyltransferase [Salipaludibacillus sp. CUR1]|uniref:glycosyltransferase n=1 Tax=Salipaludibacillus sp. CUR1 TaxID=2820003 RepID=UPI001E41AC29|nr:glycosyltransferase [Salipaludibacillus sp. CUR1]MCE7790949.1 glycosyltransferase [Salipaludibacillus sp. CUR1]
MISAITCTMREECMENVFKNYQSQNVAEKELIVILNKNTIKIEDWKKYAESFTNVSVYQLDESFSLGACLNFGAEKAAYNIVAKMDDDDYYGPDYLSEAVKVFENEKIFIAGKRAYYIYFEGSNHLRLLGANYQHKFVNHVAGATIIARKEVVQDVPFNDRETGTDTDFLKRCKQKGYKIYSISKHSFAVIRREDVQSHTWKITEKELTMLSKHVPFAGDFRKTVDNSQ